MHPQQSFRNLAKAFAFGAAAALVIDAVLRNALAAAQSPGVSSLTPWWVVGRVAERSVWAVAALLLWVFATQMSRLLDRLWPLDHVLGLSAALVVTGRLMLTAPLVWLLATWLVVGARIALAGSWDIDGRMFATLSIYHNALMAYVPWAAGGIFLLALSRHAGD